MPIFFDPAAREREMTDDCDVKLQTTFALRRAHFALSRHRASAQSRSAASRLRQEFTKARERASAASR